jgi:hypothetical protein
VRAEAGAAQLGAAAEARLLLVRHAAAVLAADRRAAGGALSQLERLVRHYMAQPLAELHGGCMVALKVS